MCREERKISLALSLEMFYAEKEKMKNHDGQNGIGDVSLLKWRESGYDVTLIARPRRFGKTLTMSMLDYFFSVNCSEKKGLFEGLSIWEHEEYRRLRGNVTPAFGRPDRTSQP